jgi:antitoxin ParD1/3/4
MGSPYDPIQVDLGVTRRIVDERIQSGTYANADEVIRAGLLALEREEAATRQWLVDLAEEALVDPRPAMPAGQVFRELRERHALPPAGIEW